MTPAPTSPKESKDEEKWVHDYLSGTRLPLAHDRELHALIAALRERVAAQEREIGGLKARAAASYAEISNWDDEWGLPDIRQMVLRALARVPEGGGK
jgi:cell division protein FtsB